MESKDTKVKGTELNETLKENEDALQKSKPKKKTGKIIAAVVSAFVAILLIVYGSIAIYFQSHFFPNTFINGVDCSDLEAAEAARLVDALILNYRLEVSGRLNEDAEQGVLGEINAADIDLHYVGTQSAVESILEQQNNLFWIEILANKHYGNSLVQGVSFDEDKLCNLVKQWEAFREMIVPQDAYIGDYSEEKNGYEIVPETNGTKMDVEVALENIKAEILAQSANYTLAEEMYESAKITTEDKELNDKVDTINTWLSAEITYDWNGSEIVVDKELLREWISFVDCEPKLDENAVAAFVAENAKERDTYGKRRKFVTTLGAEITLPSGAYGWRTDQEGETTELIQLIYGGNKVEREPLYKNKARQKGLNDIGSSYVEADLTNQHLYLYYKGQLVLETDFVSGIMTDPGCVTPYGVFGLTYKTTNAVLRGADYETPVSYWMPFHGNFGMHDATWRTEFGGDIYLTDGSHGCLNLPLDKAEAIYGYLSTGFPIICYY